MRQYGRRPHGGYEAPAVDPEGLQPPNVGSAGRSAQQPAYEMLDAMRALTAAVDRLTEAISRREKIEVTATAGDETVRLEVKS